MSLFRTDNLQNMGSPQQQQFPQQPEYKPSVIELTKSRGKKVGKWLLLLYGLLACGYTINRIMYNSPISEILTSLFGISCMFVSVFFGYLFLIFVGSFWIKD